MVISKRKKLTAFAVMNNHIHIIWQVLPGHEPSAVQLSFMRYTAQQIKFELIKDDPLLLERCKVNKGDRQYQIWKREPLGIDLFTDAVFNQKLDYIHYNPVVAGLCILPEDYHYSSALFMSLGLIILIYIRIIKVDAILNKPTSNPAGTVVRSR